MARSSAPWMPSATALASTKSSACSWRKSFEEAMAAIAANKDIAKDQAEVLATALGKANIEIVGGEGDFFNSFAKSLSVGQGHRRCGRQEPGGAGRSRPPAQRPWRSRCGDAGTQERPREQSRRRKSESTRSLLRQLRRRSARALSGAALAWPVGCARGRPLGPVSIDDRRRPRKTRMSDTQAATPAQDVLDKAVAEGGAYECCTSACWSRASACGRPPKGSTPVAWRSSATARWM